MGAAARRRSRRRGYLAAAWDMPGYGASAPPPAWTFDASRRRPRRGSAVSVSGAAHVVGLSMGGMVALHLALASPALARSLVLCDTSPAFGFDGSTTADAWIESRSRADPRPVRRRHRWRPVCSVRSWLPRATAVGRGERRRWHASIRTRSRVRCGAFPRTTCASRLAEIAAPTLVVVGELDRETPPSYARHLADQHRRQPLRRDRRRRPHLQPRATRPVQCRACSTSSPAG